MTNQWEDMPDGSIVLRLGENKSDYLAEIIPIYNGCLCPQMYEVWIMNKSLKVGFGYRTIAQAKYSAICNLSELCGLIRETLENLE